MAIDRLNRNDFLICSQWELDQSAGVTERGAPKCVVDKTTGYWYRNDDNLRSQMIIHATGGIIMHGVTVTANAAFRTLRAVSFYDFWRKRGQSPQEASAQNLTVLVDKSQREISRDMEPLEISGDEAELPAQYDCNRRARCFAKNIAKIVLTPFTFLAMQASACLGCCFPNDGRKMMISLGRFQYGDKGPLPIVYNSIVSGSTFNRNTDGY